MNLIKEKEGIKLFENGGGFYLQYDSGAHMIKEKRIKITSDEATICKYDGEEMYSLILQYQNDGVYGDEID